MVVEVTQETYFAQHLAANDPRIRNRAMKKLGRWLAARATAGKGLEEDDLLKIWKGLFYCMWMCDKPLVQEALADKISELLNYFKQLPDALRFIDTFFQTMSREWFGIDRYRLEKFMMLMRRFVFQCFGLLKSYKWKLAAVRPLMDVMKKTVLNPRNNDIPTGLKFHIFDVFMDELCKAGGNKLTTKQICWFLRPFAEFLVICEDNSLCESVVKEVFHKLIFDAVDDSDDDDEYETEEILKSQNKFIVDFDIIADRLVQLSSGDKIRQRNRARIYKLIGRYRDIANGVFPFEKKDDSESGTDVDDIDIDSKAKGLLPVGKKRRSFPKRKSRRRF